MAINPSNSVFDHGVLKDLFGGENRDSNEVFERIIIIPQNDKLIISSKINYNSLNKIINNN